MKHTAQMSVCCGDTEWTTWAGWDSFLSRVCICRPYVNLCWCSWCLTHLFIIVLLFCFLFCCFSSGLSVSCDILSGLCNTVVLVDLPISVEDFWMLLFGVMCTFSLREWINKNIFPKPLCDSFHFIHWAQQQLMGLFLKCVIAIHLIPDQ